MNPLTGKRILVTRPRAQSAGLLAQLSEWGAQPLEFPTIEIQEPPENPQLDRAITDLHLYDWVIFTSVNGVAAFWKRLAVLGKTAVAFAGVKVAAIGPATAQALRERGAAVDFVPEKYVAEAILPGLGDVSGKRILLARADIARKALYTALVEAGARPEEIAVYSTRPAAVDPHMLDEVSRGVDIVLFTSSSTVRHCFSILGDQAGQVLGKALIACIGPVTAQTAREYGLEVTVEASRHTIAGLLAALNSYYGQEMKDSTWM